MAGRGRPIKKEEEKAKPNDKINCNICGKIYTRANQTRHKKSKYHTLAERLTQKMYIIYYK